MRRALSVVLIKGLMSGGWSCCQAGLPTRHYASASERRSLPSMGSARQPF